MHEIGAILTSILLISLAYEYYRIQKKYDELSKKYIDNLNNKLQLTKEMMDENQALHNRIKTLESNLHSWRDRN